MNNNDTSHKNCLVLNSDYTPIAIIDWRKAVIWSFKKEESMDSSVEIMEYYSDDFVAGLNRQVKIPAVIRTSYYLKVYNRPVNFSRTNLFLRDNYTCQYCNCQFSISQLTYDHVIPRSRYKSNYRKCTHWTNIVTSCKQCNNKKGNKTPEEAGMTLKTRPYQPKYSEKYLRWHTQTNIISESSPDEWKKFLGY